MIQRRNFIKKTAALLGTGIVASTSSMAGLVGPSRNILVVSGWQDVNIGDIAHTPGLLHVLETFLPDAKITLWKKSKDKQAVHDMLASNFPKIKIVYGNVEADGVVRSESVQDAFKAADIMVHGSGPHVVGQPHLEAWVKQTEKPFGIFGTTIQDISENLKKLLDKAAFIYTRETASLKVLKEVGVKCKEVGFAPDATFFLNLQDNRTANAFLKEAGLEARKFICVIPRLRYTPYHKFANAQWSSEKIEQVETTNEKWKESDHAKLREAMIAWVRNTGNKVLVCPEMTYQIEIMDELLIDPLPPDVRPNVVKRGYWLPDEAASVYEKAFAVLSFECHSPIIAAANTTPFFYLRQPEDTIKGQMYYDLGFDQWVFEIEKTEGKQISNRLMSIYKDYAVAKKSIETSMKRIAEIYEVRSKVIANFS